MDCHKERCPALDGCSSKDAIRPDPLSCCKVCPQKEEKIVEKSAKPYPVITNTDSQELNDMGSERSGLDILASGGCALKGNYHENGEHWHPHVKPWGKMVCVICTCKVRKYLRCFLVGPIMWLS